MLNRREGNTLTETSSGRKIYINAARKTQQRYPRRRGYPRALFHFCHGFIRARYNTRVVLAAIIANIIYFPRIAPLISSHI